MCKTLISFGQTKPVLLEIVGYIVHTSLSGPVNSLSLLPTLGTGRCRAILSSHGVWELRMIQKTCHRSQDKLQLSPCSSHLNI